MLSAEIDVRGNNVSIADGDNSSSSTDGTAFGSVATDDVIVTRTFTIANTGTTAANLTGSPRVRITGLNPADFTVTNQPDAAVAAGGSTTFTVAFNPSAAGLRTAMVNIANDDTDENPYNFAISGTGLAQGAEIDVRGNGVSIADGDNSSSSTDGTAFGSIGVDGGTVTRSFTVFSTGNATLNLTGAPRVQIAGSNASDFTVSDSPGASISPGSSTTFTITFNPSSLGLRTATVSIASNDSDENPYNFAISGTGASIAPEMDVRGNAVSIVDGDSSPSSTDGTAFGDINVDGDNTNTQSFTVFSTGNATLNLTGAPRVQITGSNASDFTVSDSPGASISPGSSSTFTITFNPSNLGLRTATVSIASNDSDENPYNFDLSGTGVTIAPEIDVRGNGVSIVDGDTSASSTDGTSFGSINADGGGTVTRSFTVFSTGNATLNLTDTPRVQITGSSASDFTVTSQPGASISAGSSSTFRIVFNPSNLGLRTATVSIASNDSDENPYNFAVSGTGTPIGPEIDVRGNGVSIVDGDTSPSSTDGTSFGSQSVASGTVSRSFTIANTGSAALGLSGAPRVQISGANAFDFTVSGQPGPTLAAGSSVTFAIIFNPSAAGVRTATVTIFNNDTDENPYNFNISGTGTATAALTGASVVGDTSTPKTGPSINTSTPSASNGTVNDSSTRTTNRRNGSGDAKSKSAAPAFAAASSDPSTSNSTAVDDVFADPTFGELLDAPPTTTTKTRSRSK